MVLFRTEKASISDRGMFEDIADRCLTDFIHNVKWYHKHDKLWFHYVPPPPTTTKWKPFTTLRPCLMQAELFDPFFSDTLLERP